MKSAILSVASNPTATKFDFRRELARKCDLEGVPFGHFQMLPTGSKPVKNWADRDSAWTDVATGVRKAIDQLRLSPVTSFVR